MIWGVVLVLIILGSWLWWAKPGATESDRKRLESLVGEHTSLAERVVDLSDRAERYRHGEGATGQAFANAEAIFTRVSQAWGEVSDQVSEIQAAASKKDFGPLRQGAATVTQRLSQLSGLLDEFAVALDRYQAQWQAAPGAVSEAVQAVQQAAEAVRQVEASLGFEVADLHKRLASLQAFLTTAQELTRTNPTEAALKAQDLAKALERFQAEVNRYQSAASAMAGATADIAEVREAARAAGKLEQPEVVAGLAAAEAAREKLLPAARAAQEHLLQEALLAVQEALRSARRAMREQ